MYHTGRYTNLTRSYATSFLLAAMLFCASSAVADDGRCYGGGSIGVTILHTDYTLSLENEGTYIGYKTSSASSSTCAPCLDPVTGLSDRSVLFSNESSMELDRGMLFSLSGGISYDSLATGVQFFYLYKKEKSFDEGTATLMSDTWSLVVYADYVMSSGTYEAISPYVGVGIGIAHYLAHGSFIMQGPNSVSNVPNVPDTLIAKGDFDNVIDYTATTQLRLGLLISTSEAISLDLSLKYVAMGRISTSGNTSNVYEADDITQDPGAAQSPGTAGCNGNIGANCTGAVSLPPTDTVPILFTSRSLYIDSLRNNTLIIDLGARFFF